MKDVSIIIEYPSSEWIRPKMKGWKMGCCDCGLIHTIDFKIEKKGRRNVVLMRIKRDEEATEFSRRLNFF